MAHWVPVPMAQRPMGWALRQLLHNPDPGVVPSLGQGRVGGGESPTTRLPCTTAFTDSRYHSFSSVSLLANWAGRPGEPGGPGAPGAPTAPVSPRSPRQERSQAQGGTSRGGKEGCGSDS